MLWDSPGQSPLRRCWVGGSHGRLGGLVVAHHPRRADVRSLKPEQLWTPGEFDFVFCGPDCTEFSLAKSTAPRDYAKGDSIVIACFDIIRYLATGTDKQVFWALESPLTGFLRKQEHMLQWSPFLKRADFCKYGKPYMKQMAIWKN